MDGGKGLIWRNILNEQPPHRVYVEPFLGHSWTLRHKRPAELTIGCELNEDTLEAWLFDQDRTGFLAGMGAETLQVGRVGHALTTPQVFTARLGNERGPLVELRHASGLELLQSREALCWGHDVLVYADPPYLFSTRASKERIYRHELGTAKEHARLLTALKRLRCRVQLSGYPSPQYAQALDSRIWRFVDIPTTNRAGRRVIERLWCNYPATDALHDYRWLGQGWRDRENLNRMRRRWRNKLAAMPLARRRALLAAIAELGEGR